MAAGKFPAFLAVDFLARYLGHFDFIGVAPSAAIILLASLVCDKIHNITNLTAQMRNEETKTCKTTY